MEKKTNRRIVTAGLLIAMFIGALDATVVGTAMPSIIDDLQGLSLISWVFSIYTLAACVTTPIFGKLSDLFGRKIVFGIGLVLFIISSVLCGAAQSMPALIGFRALQGIGAGALTPVIFTIIGDMYPGEQRAKMQGLFASVWSVAGLLGPLVGGYFVDQITWRWIFYINVPVGIIGFILVFGFLHERFEKKAESIDYLGAITFTLGISALMYALLNGGSTYAWNSPVMIFLFAVAIGFLLLFLRVERRAKDPMMPLSLFKHRSLAIAYTFAFLGFCIVAGVGIYMPMWIQTLLGQSATGSGMTLMPMSIAWPVAAILSGRYMYRLGSKAFIVAGALIVCAGGLWLTLLQIDSPYWYLSLIMIVIGFGMGCMTTPAMVIIQSAVGWQMRGVANSTNSLMSSLGQTIGVAAFGMVFNSVVTVQTNAHFAQGIHSVFLFILGIALINLLVICFLPSHQKIMEQQVA